MIKTVLAGMLSFGFAVGAYAADVKAPVEEVTAALVTNWKEAPAGSDAPPEYVDYFSEDFLNRLYSRDFAATYRAATRFPAYDGGDSPFDYDVLAMGQDGCSIKDLKIEAMNEAAGVTPVRARFDNTHCLDDRPADWKPAQVTFEVIEEGGHAVIDDIIRETTTTPSSLKEEMQGIISTGQSAPQE